MKTISILFLLFLSDFAASNASARDLYACHPNPLVMGERKITIQTDGTYYELKLSYLAQIYPGDEANETVIPVTLSDEAESWNFSGEGCEIDVYPHETVTIGGANALRAYVPYCAFTDTIHLENRDFFCLPE